MADAPMTDTHSPTSTEETESINDVDIVKDGQADRVSRPDCLSFFSGADGRIKFHKPIYLWTTSRKGDDAQRIDKYLPEKYGPTHPLYQKVGDILPDSMSMKPDDATNSKKCMAVGLIDGASLNLHCNPPHSGGSRKHLDLEKLRKGAPIPRPEHALPVFMEVTAQISERKEKRLFVGCLEWEGYLQAKSVNKDDVFYYPEFWEAAGLPAGREKDVTARRRIIGQTLRYCVAEEKVPMGQGDGEEDGPAAAAEADDLTLLSSATAVNVEHEADRADSPMQLAGSTKDAALLVETGTQTWPPPPDHHTQAPPALDDSSSAFFTWTKQLSWVESTQLLQKLRLAHPSMSRTITTSDVMALHIQLRARPDLRERIPRAGMLPLLLDLFVMKPRALTSLEGLVACAEVFARHRGM